EQQRPGSSLPATHLSTLDALSVEGEMHSLLGRVTVEHRRISPLSGKEALTRLCGETHECAPAEAAWRPREYEQIRLKNYRYTITPVRGRSTMNCTRLGISAWFRGSSTSSCQQE